MNGTNGMNGDNDVNMDIDMDIDFAVDPEIEQLEAESMRIDAEGAPRQNAQNGTAPIILEGAASVEAVPEKVNVQGVDNLTTDDVKSFVAEHCPSEEFERVEWVNDTSVNLIYKTAEAASKALTAFTTHDIIDPSSVPVTAERKAKKFTRHPDVQLQVRQANITDVKKQRAREESRFYLLNPEYDRHEQRAPRRGRGGRPRGDRDVKGDYSRRRFDDREHKRRQDAEDFDVSMYDDDAGSAMRNGSQNGSRSDRRGSAASMYSSEENGRTKRVRFRGRRQPDIFAKDDEAYGRLRDRSASPGSEGDGRMGFEEDPNSIGRKIRQRSLTPPSRRRDNYRPREKELFGGREEPASLFSDRNQESARELFASKPSHQPRRSRELFPNRTDTSNHRRSDALDQSAHVRLPKDLFSRISKSDTQPPKGDLFSRITKEGEETSFGRLKDDFSEGPSKKDSSKGDLFSRITKDDKESGYGRLKDSDNDREGFNIRGSADQAGFSIRGASDGKEAFDTKFGGKGRELFGEKIRGRGAARKRAEDLFG